MQNLELQIDGKQTPIELQQVELHLPAEDQLALAAQIQLTDTGETKQFSAVAIPGVADQGQRIALDVLSAEGQGLSVDFIAALFEKVMELLDLRNFDIQGITLRLKSLKAEPGKLLLHATTLVEQFPSV